MRRLLAVVVTCDRCRVTATVRRASGLRWLRASGWVLSTRAHPAPEDLCPLHAAQQRRASQAPG